MSLKDTPRRPTRVGRTLPALSADEMRRIDRQAVDVYGIALLQMMELAGRSLALSAHEMMGDGEVPGQVLVLCGAGNNGGGGMVAARHLHGWGFDVTVRLVPPPERLKPAPRHQWSILDVLGLVQSAGEAPPANSPRLIVDALFGYGFHGEPNAAAARWIQWANDQPCPVVSLDLPSGLDATTGSTSDPCIRAARTLTLAAPKKGLWTVDAQPFVGEVWLADIGIPSQAFSDLGLGGGPVFSAGPIVLLSEREV